MPSARSDRLTQLNQESKQENIISKFNSLFLLGSAGKIATDCFLPEILLRRSPIRPHLAANWPRGTDHSANVISETHDFER
jgi:hypothetical protein